MGKDRLPEATGEKHFPIEELATAVQVYIKKSPTTAVFRNWILVVFGSEYKIEHLPALKNSLEKGRKKMKKEDRDNENLCCIILNYSSLFLGFVSKWNTDCSVFPDPSPAAIPF